MFIYSFVDILMVVLSTHVQKILSQHYLITWNWTLMADSIAPMVILIDLPCLARDLFSHFPDA